MSSFCNFGSIPDFMAERNVHDVHDVHFFNPFLTRTIENDSYFFTQRTVMNVVEHQLERYVFTTINFDQFMYSLPRIRIQPNSPPLIGALTRIDAQGSKNGTNLPGRQNQTLARLAKQPINKLAQLTHNNDLSFWTCVNAAKEGREYNILGRRKRFRRCWAMHFKEEGQQEFAPN